MAITNFYPPITDLVGTDRIPDKLGLLKKGIAGLIDDLFNRKKSLEINQILNIIVNL